MADLLQVAELPPFLADRLKEYTIHDFTDPEDPDALLDEVGPKIRTAGGMKGPTANLINRLPNLKSSRRSVSVSTRPMWSRRKRATSL